MTGHDQLRERIREFIGLSTATPTIEVETRETTERDGFTRSLIQYVVPDGDVVPAYLLEPEGSERGPGVVIHHQHAGQRPIGKSEVCGLAGDPLQAFGPRLAQAGFLVLAPDSICFEDRRRPATVEKADVNTDALQHYNELTYRIVTGGSLGRKVLSDSWHAVSVLSQHPRMDKDRLGMLGHSYGGNTTLFSAALDERVRFACSSGAACSYKYKLEHHIAIEMAEVIPGFAGQFDIDDLVKCIAPRPLLIVSADEDMYSADADRIADSAREDYRKLERSDALVHHRYSGGHALDPERMDSLLGWVQETGAPPQQN